MKITVKNLKSESHVIEVEPNETIEQLQNQLASIFNCSLDQIKLIHKSKQLEPNCTIEHSQIQENDSIVCMILKVK